jgi:UDP-3-O-[3-hydroxymyristoyl] glucosamine N-acyltransferase
MPELSLADLAVIVGGELRGPGERTVRGVAPLDTAGPEELSFVANPRYLPYLQGAQAGAVLVPPELRERIPPEMAAVVVEDPHLALYRLLPRLYPRAEREAAIHPTAIIDPTATVGAGVSVGPYAVIEAEVRLADGCSIGAHVVVGRGCAGGGAGGCDGGHPGRSDLLGVPRAATPRSDAGPGGALQAPRPDASHPGAGEGGTSGRDR